MGRIPLWVHTALADMYTDGCTETLLPGPVAHFMFLSIQSLKGSTLVLKKLPANGLGRSPEEENGSPVQYSCLGDPMDRIRHDLATKHHQQQRRQKTSILQTVRHDERNQR